MRETRILPVPLTNDEMVRFSEQLAAKIYEHERVERESKTAREDYKAQLSTIKKEFDRLKQIVRERSEDRHVEVYEVLDRDRYVVNIYRADTHEIIETRNMDYDERHPQQKLPLSDDPAVDEGTEPMGLFQNKEDAGAKEQDGDVWVSQDEAAQEAVGNKAVATLDEPTAEPDGNVDSGAHAGPSDDLAEWDRMIKGTSPIVDNPAVLADESPIAPIDEPPPAPARKRGRPTKQEPPPHRKGKPASKPESDKRPSRPRSTRSKPTSSAS